MEKALFLLRGFSLKGAASTTRYFHKQKAPFSKEKDAFCFERRKSTIVNEKVVFWPGKKGLDYDNKSE